MSFLKKLFGGKRPGKPLREEVDRLYREHGPAKGWDAIRSALDAMDPARMEAADQETWHHARGMIEFAAGRRDQTLAVFERGVKLFPASSIINFGLGQEYEFHGRAEEMAACFRKVRLEQAGGTFFMASCRYLYLWGRLDEAQAALAQVFDAYHRLLILDDHFLYTRGLPFFSEAFGTLAAVAVAAGRPEVAEKELDHARRRLKDYLFDFDAAALEAEVRDNRQPVIRWADSVALEMERHNGATGYQRMLAAAHRARGQYSLDRARAVVEAVKLTDRDHLWLEDLRLEYRAELAAAAEDFETEKKLLEEFFVRQPRLFEPHHAFAFGLVKYQERLKPMYQRTRRGEKL